MHLYLQEDLVIPGSMTFYELIVNKARGKSGPLFSFDVHEDIRIVNDASKEKDETHAGKVCADDVLGGTFDDYVCRSFCQTNPVGAGQELIGQAVYASLMSAQLCYCGNLSPIMLSSQLFYRL
jgi:hypothetical protein